MDKDTERETAAYLEQMMGEYYQTNHGVTKFDGLTFLLADVMHYCDSHGIRYNAVVQAAKWHYISDGGKT